MLRFTTNEAVSADIFRDVLLRSTLDERRPVDDIHCFKMIEHSNLIVTAWDGQLLVGIARSVTDFHYCCYLSDLRWMLSAPRDRKAVDSDHPRSIRAALQDHLVVGTGSGGLLSVSRFRAP